MRPIILAPALVILILSADAARACGRRCRCRRAPAQAVVVQPYSYAPAVVVQPYSYAPVAYQSWPTAVVETPTLAAPPPYPTVVQATPATPRAEVQPLYTYEAGAESGAAYYYTYDESGKLVVKQWMDWLFRGGRRAGLPAPPLPLVGRLNN